MRTEKNNHKQENNEQNRNNLLTWYTQPTSAEESDKINAELLIGIRYVLCRQKTKQNKMRLWSNIKIKRIYSKKENEIKK